MFTFLFWLVVTDWLVAVGGEFTGIQPLNRKVINHDKTLFAVLFCCLE
jgi:hypothetical protein